MFQAVLVIFLMVSHVQALEMSKRDFCLSQAEAQNYQSPQKFKVVGAVSHPALITTVAKLVDEFEIAGPLIFHFTDYVGPKKVWSLPLSDGKHIYFAKNAVDLLLGIELQKIADEVCRPEWTGRKTFTVTYTNTVMEQFLRHAATKESLEKVLMKRTGWKLRSVPGEKHYEEEQEFRTEELVTLVKQLMDIPADVFKKMKIKKVTRWRYGAAMPIKTAKAIYYVQEQKLQFSDAALMDNGTDIYGEGTILHEMGHAFWYGVSESTKDKFTGISWVKQNNKWERLSGTSDGFITDYAMTSPEEDFAEHFSAYMHQPELLERRASRKKGYFEDEVFTDASFFSTVAENAKVKIDSPNPDTKDPWLLTELTSSFKAVATPRNDGSKITDVSLVIDNAMDDISGISPSLHSFVHKENDQYRIIIKLTPEIQSDSTYRLIGSFVTDPGKLAPGYYQSSTFGLEDMAGNTKFYDPKGIPDLYIDGNLSVETRKRLELDVAQIKLEPAPVKNGYHGVITSLPIAMQEDFNTIHLTWEFSALEGKTVHVCKKKKFMDYEVPCLLTGKTGENIKILSYFHKQYPRSAVKLANIYIEHKGTSQSAKSSDDYIIPQGLPNASTTVDSGAKELSLIDLEVNQMKLQALTRENDDGGDQNIQVTVPIQNSDSGKFYIMSKVRSPTGKGILGIVTERMQKDYEVIQLGEQKFIKFTIPLRKNPEDGVYILESFEVRTEYERPFNPSLPLDQNKLTVKKIKLLERGIRRTFTISDDKIINLN